VLEELHEKVLEVEHEILAAVASRPNETETQKELKSDVALANLGSSPGTKLL
jgi:hypothetical protein